MYMATNEMKISLLDLVPWGLHVEQNLGNMFKVTTLIGVWLIGPAHMNTHVQYQHSLPLICNVMITFSAIQFVCNYVG